MEKEDQREKTGAMSATLPTDGNVEEDLVSVKAVQSQPSSLSKLPTLKFAR